MPTNPDLKAVPVRVAEAVPYADGSVVSRTLIQRDGGRLTLFSFDEGEGLSEQTSRSDLAVHVLDGEALLSIDGNAARLRAGELLVVPAGAPHSLQAATRLKLLLMQIR